MQKYLAPVLFLFPFSLFSQNMQDQKITVKYKQLPLVNINDGSNMYSVAVETPYLQKNQDSLAFYELSKQNYLNEVQAALENWRLQQTGAGDRVYWAQMANYENQVNAGVTNAPMPQLPPQAPFTFTKPYPKAPFMLKEVNGSSVIAGIKIDGMTQSASAPVKITLVWNGFEKGMMKENKTGTGPTTKYRYEVLYRHRVNIKVEVPGKGLVINEPLMEAEEYKKFTTSEFKTKGDFRLWWMDNEKTFWEQRQDEIVMQHVALINAYLNNKVGYPNKQRTIEIYTVKSKDFDYGDYMNAYKVAQDGFLKVEYGAAKDAEVKQKLQEAINIWNEALKSSDINNKKARIDRTVTAASYINLAQAYCWMGDYVNCEINCNKALGVDVGKYNREARPLLEFVRDQKARAEANM